ncbi:MAG: GNA1162 family protein [Planctomycetota bacterium]
MPRTSHTRKLSLLLALPLALDSCGGPGVARGVTEAFALQRPSSIHVLEPSEGPLDSAALRGLLEQELRRKGYEVTWPADATLSTRVEAWGEQASWSNGSGARVALSAALLSSADGAELWRGDGRAWEQCDDDDDGGLVDGLFEAVVDGLAEPLTQRRQEVAEEAVWQLLDSLPGAGE